MSKDDDKQLNNLSGSEQSSQTKNPVIHFFPKKVIKLNAVPNTVTKRKERCEVTQNRQKVLETAHTLFAERGIENVTMSEIAEVAGVGKGTLYRRFAHKGILCQALMDENSRLFQQEVLSGFGDTGRNATPLARLYLFIERFIDFTEVNSNFLLAAFEIEAEKDAKSYYSQPFYNWLRVTMKGLLSEAIASGECREEIDVEYFADILLTPFQIGLYLHQRQILGFSQERIKAGIYQLLKGILKPN